MVFSSISASQLGQRCQPDRDAVRPRRVISFDQRFLMESFINPVCTWCRLYRGFWTGENLSRDGTDAKILFAIGS